MERRKDAGTSSERNGISVIIKLRTIALFLAVAIALCYAGSIYGTFHFDDTHSVESNLAIRSIKNIPSFWTDPRTSSFIPENRVYRPMVYTLYSFCWLFGGGSTVPFHIMKILMHFFVCLALYLIWFRFWSEPGWFPAKNLKFKLPAVSRVFEITPQIAALLLAFLFAIHPACSECVDYIAATTSLQCAMFYVWAYYAYLVFRDKKNPKALFASLFLYFLSVASKEEGITLPAIVALTELFLYRGKATARVVEAIKKSIPFWGLAAVFAYWIFLMHPSEGNESRGWVSPFQYFITEWRAYLWYVRLWFWPWDLNADVAAMEGSSSFFEPLVIQAAIGNLGLLLIGWFNRKKYPAFLFGLLWFYITIAPASSVVVLAEYINEHRMYLSYVGFVGGAFTLLLAAAEGLFAPEKRERKLGWLYVVICVGLFTGSQERNRVWANDENLWQDTVEKNPTSGRALNNLALVYMGKGNYAKAVENLAKCEVHWNSYMYCPLNRGVAFQNLAAAAEGAGKVEDAKANYGQAESAFQRAYSLNPRSVHTNYHLGRFYEDVRKDYAKAAELFNTAVTVTGGRYPDADFHLSFCYMKLHRYDEALVAINRGLSIDPGNESLLFARAQLQYETGDLTTALASFDYLLKNYPLNGNAWLAYGTALMSRADFLGARKALEQHLQLLPKSDQGWYNYSVTLEKLSQGKPALDAARQAVGLNPNRPELKSHLGALEKRYGSLNSEVKTSGT